LIVLFSSIKPVNWFEWSENSSFLAVSVDDTLRMVNKSDFDLSDLDDDDE